MRLDGNPVVLRLVDAPESTGVVLFDFNDRFGWAQGDTFTVTPPIVDGEIGAVAGEFGFGGVGWSQTIRGVSNAHAMALQADLARALQRRAVYLLVQFGAGTPRFWFTVVRATGGVVVADVTTDGSPSDWAVSVQLTVEPYALGERRTHTVTVANDPAATNGLRVTLPDPGGDGPAPLTVELSAGASSYVAPVLAVINIDGGPPATWMWQAETFTPLTGATVGADVTASGGSRMNVTVNTSDTSTGRMRRTITPNVSGRYRLYARVQLTSNAGGVGGYVDVSASATGLEPVTTRVQFGGWQLVDLGLFTTTAGNPPAGKPYTLGGTALTINARADLSFYTIAVDYVVAVPVDLPLDQVAPGRLLEFTSGTSTNGAVNLKVNGDLGVVELVSTAGVHSPGAAQTPAGVFPALQPGGSNVLYLLTRRRVSATSHDDVVSTGSGLVLSWHPRHLVGYFSGV